MLLMAPRNRQITCAYVYNCFFNPGILDLTHMLMLYIFILPHELLENFLFLVQEYDKKLFSLLLEKKLKIERLLVID